MSTIRFVTDNGDTEDIGDIDPHFYEKQVAPSSPFGSNAFDLAVAVAKDRARVQLVKAVRQADLDARSKGFGLGLQGFSNGVLIKRSVDGVNGAPDDAIKL
jgi:hypothetical protein